MRSLGMGRSTHGKMIIAAPLVLCLALAAPAAAQPPQDGGEPASEDACVTSFEQAQTLREAGALLDARSALRICADAGCRDFARTRCIGWLEEVESVIPTLVVSAKGADGQDLSAVRVLIDGRLAAPSLDGRPLEIDPGPHTLRFEVEGGDSQEQQILAKIGEQNRVVEVTFAAPTPAEPPAYTPAPPASSLPNAATPESGGDSSAWPPIFWAALGVGGAGLVVGGVTGALAISQGADLQERCPAGKCPASATEGDLDGAKALADASTIAFVAGGVLAAVGAVGLIVTWSGDEEEATPRLSATLGFGAAGLQGRF